MWRVAELENQTYRIAENPLLYQISRKKTRKCNLRKFPYSICFIFKKSTVYIMAISHHKQKPYYWIHRKIDEINQN